MAKNEKTEQTVVEDVPAPLEDGVTEETFTVQTKEKPVDILKYISEPDIRLGTDRREKITFTMGDGTLVEAIIRPISVDESNEINQFSINQGVSADKIVMQRALYGMDGKTHLPDLVLEKLEGGIGNKITSKIMELSGFGDESDEKVELIKKN